MPKCDLQERTSSRFSTWDPFLRPKSPPQFSYARYQGALKKALSRSEKLRKLSLKMVDLDVVAYQSGKIKKALGVPLSVCRLCFEAIRLCPALIRQGNINLISDVAVAAILLEGAFASAYFNVEINLKYIADKKLKRAIGKELGQKSSHDSGSG